MVCKKFSPKDELYSCHLNPNVNMPENKKLTQYFLCNTFMDFQELVQDDQESNQVKGSIELLFVRKI